MSGKQIRSVFVPSSAILRELGDALGKIRQEDRLTWADMDEVLGKRDRAAHYADGSAEMGVTAYYRAKARWNGRFTRGADALVEGAHADADSDHVRQSKVLKAALGLSIALEDGEIDLNEIIANRATLENARDAIDGLLAKLAPQRKGQQA